MGGQIWLVRHGQTEWAQAKRHTGRTDVPLTAEGERQAEALGALLGGRSFARVLTSPLQRAWRTAELAGFADVQVDDELVELDYGDYEGRTSADIRAERPGWLVWNDGSPGGESIEEAGARADRVIERLEAVDGDVLVFGHGHFSRLVAARLLALPPGAGRLLMLAPAGIGIVGFEHGRRAIRVWNWSAELG